MSNSVTLRLTPAVVLPSSGSGFDAPAFIAGFDDVAVLRQPIEQRRCHLGVNEHGRPSGIIHVLKSGCRWRGCPAVYGSYTTVYNRWNRWCRRAVWRRLFEALREVPRNDDFHAIDSTTAKAHRAAAGGKGGQTQAIGRSRGGRTTKIHAVCDPLRRLIAVDVSPGQPGDVRAAVALLGPLPPPRLCAADTAYDANGLRQFLTARHDARHPEQPDQEARPPLRP